jgi:hypothetical protein
LPTGKNRYPLYRRLMGHRSGLVPRLTMVVAIRVHGLNIHGITVDGFNFACFTAVDNTGCHSFQDNLSSFFFINTEVLKYIPLQFLF